VVFTGRGKGELRAGDDAEEIAVFSRKNLPEDLAFDHGNILRDYFGARRPMPDRGRVREVKS
jgi:8-oxo-dGTP diphosphatase